MNTGVKKLLNIHNVYQDDQEYFKIRIILKVAKKDPVKVNIKKFIIQRLAIVEIFAISLYNISIKCMYFNSSIEFCYVL